MWPRIVKDGVGIKQIGQNGIEGKIWHGIKEPLASWCKKD